ncbi:MAG: phosphate ABC transporter substrate-binding protein PstS family protein, partial [Planctomycetes bacterium]|nr:phosphate ABC transporter substrate-binding protein PstS family protein [Planctomycetota bacterium]
MTEPFTPAASPFRILRFAPRCLSRILSFGFGVLPALVLFVLAGCGRPVDPNEPQGFIQAKGSDTMVNAVQMVSEEFMKEYPHVFVAVTGGGSGVGIASLINRTCEVATTSREMKPKEIDMALKRGVNPKEIVIAYDGIAVIVNRNNPIDELTIEDLHRIFTGKAVNWNQFGGKNLAIVTLSREVSSGTHMYFKEEVVQLHQKDSQEEFSKATLLLTSSQAIVEEVAGNEGAIGYLGMGYMSDRTKAVRIGKRKEDFHPPTVEDVVNKTYPLSRPLYAYTNGEPRGIVKVFIDFALSPIGQKQFVETGFVPVTEENPKSESRNSKQISMTETEENPKRLAPGSGVWSFLPVFFGLGLVSDFGFRISNFRPRRWLQRRVGEPIVELCIRLSGLAVVIFVFMIFLFLLRDSLSLFREYSLRDFLFGREWLPISEPPHFGVVPLLLGSILVTFWAIVICVPLGVGSAMFIAEVAPKRLRTVLKSLVEILASIPSVVLGFLGIIWLAPVLRDTFHLSTGMCGLTGSLLLAFMALPTIISISEDAIAGVPRTYREAAFGLGATRWQT